MNEFCVKIKEDEKQEITKQQAKIINCRKNGNDKKGRSVVREGKFVLINLLLIAAIIILWPRVIVGQVVKELWKMKV